MNASVVLNPRIKENLVKILCSNFRVLSGRKVLGYTEEASRLLKFLVEGEYLERNLVNEAVHYHLLEIGYATQLMHLHTGTFPDHLGSNEVFGYALKHEKVHPDDVTFDHGETAEEYILASEGLLEAVLDQLLSYKSPEHLSSNSDDLCCGAGI